MDGGGEGGSVCRVQRLVSFSMGIRKMMWCHIKKAAMNYHSHKFISCSRLAEGLQLELEGGRVPGETLVGVYKTLLEVSSYNLTFKLQACNSLMIQGHTAREKRAEAGRESEGSKHFGRVSKRAPCHVEGVKPPVQERATQNKSI